MTDVAVNKSSLLSRGTIELTLGRHVAETIGYMNPRSATRVEFVPMCRRPMEGGSTSRFFHFFIFFFHDNSLKLPFTDVAVNKSSYLSRGTIELKLGRHVAETSGYMNPRSATRVEFVPMGGRLREGSSISRFFNFYFFRNFIHSNNIRII